MRLRYASGVRKDDLIDRARRLSASVDPLLPTLTPDCPTERFDRLRRDLEEVREAKDDPRRLARMARWGDPIVRAYAGLMHFPHEPEMPGVIALPVGDEEFSFAPLSKGTPEAEVAVQHFEDPKRLELGYQDLARKGYHFFATEKRLWCTGRASAPPAEFRSTKIANLPYRFLEATGGGRFDCTHLFGGEPRPYLEVGWTGAGTKFRLCRRCARGERQLYNALIDGVLVPDFDSEFPIRVQLNVTCHGGESCVHARLPGLSGGALRSYLRGRLTDGELLAQYLEEIRPRLEGTRNLTLVAGGVCYGGDRARFLDALGPTPVERRAIEASLEEVFGLFEVDEPSASRVLERLWADHAEAIVESIVDDPAEARRYLDEGQRAPGRIAELLKRAQRRSQEREVLDSLPRYARLAREAAYVDAIARAFRSQGAQAAERAATHALPHEGKERGLAYAILLALGRAPAHAWQFSNTEKEFGAALAEPARQILSAPPERYHEALDRLFQAAGVAHWGERAASAKAP